MSRIVLVLAFFFGTAAAIRYIPSISLKVTDPKLTKKGLALGNLGGEFETKLNDDLSVGGEYENALKLLFVRWSRNGGDPDWTRNYGGSKLNVLARMKFKGNSADADVTYSHDKTYLVVNLDSTRKTIVNRASLSHKLKKIDGRWLTLNPKWKADGNKWALRARLDLNDNAHVEVEGDVFEKKKAVFHNAVLRVAYRVDESNRFTPELDLKSGRMSYEWERTLGDGNSFTASINPNDKVMVEWKDVRRDSGARGAWTTRVNVPWGNSKDMDVTFQRRFNF
jgi:hypothetical protein